MSSINMRLWNQPTTIIFLRGHFAGKQTLHKHSTVAVFIMQGTTEVVKESLRK